ncbi:DUF2244 domain-containing protein [Pseudoxanthomonas mexicana]|uniref:DUF2244 domain-containing protein n=1 Tax=Pseudoxanthomonas mexicana TaxID=128785 RepID=UPI00398BAC8E
MIQVLPPSTGSEGTQLRLRPPRALTASQFVGLFAALAGLMWLVAGLGWLAGNAYAPAFALLHSALAAAALRWLWRSGERGEDITVDPEVVEVQRAAGVVFHAHPYWVRLQVEAEGERISLASGGRRVEVGSFLGPGERRELAGRLQELLAVACGRNR